MCSTCSGSARYCTWGGASRTAVGLQSISVRLIYKRTTASIVTDLSLCPSQKWCPNGLRVTNWYMLQSCLATKVDVLQPSEAIFQGKSWMLVSLSESVLVCWGHVGVFTYWLCLPARWQNGSIKIDGDLSRFQVCVLVHACVTNKLRTAIHIAMLQFLW